jgi:VWFA-related protein
VLALRNFAASALFLVLCSAALRAQAPNPSAPSIRVQVDQVNVGVIVTDQRGKFVEDLHRENFQVFDNNVEQPLAGFTSIDGPAQVLLLVESGPAVYLLEGSHLAAVSTLLNGLSSDDRIAMAAYADTPRFILDFTADKGVALANLNQLHFNLGSTNLNLSSTLASILDWLVPLQGKKTIVLLSTGVDTSSPEIIDAVFARIKLTDIRVFTLSLSGSLRGSPPATKRKNKNPVPAPADNLFAEADAELRALAQSTGGRSYFPLTSAEFKTACAEIAQLVRHEYSLSFAAPAHDAAIHSIDVRISTPGAQPSTLRMDHRGAYLAPQ